MSKAIKVYVALFVFSIGLILSGANSALANTAIFSDIPSSFWAKEEIQFLHSKGIINGYDQGSSQVFRPNNEVTRAQAAKMIMIAIGKTESKSKQSSFKDIPSGHWALGWIERANELGIITGYEEDGTFRPNDSLTRAQMSKIISRAFGLDVSAAEEKEIVFSDITRKYWASHYINTLYYNGISNGSGQLFKPTEKISRAHFSVFISRALEEDFRFDPVEPTPAPAPKPVEPTPTPEEPKPEPVKPTPPSGEVISQGKVTADVLNVRSGPGTTHPVIGQLAMNSQVSIYGINGDWVTINFNNTTGYVHKRYIKIVNLEGNPLQNRIIVVDAGHGGSDPGAVNGSTYEKNIVIEVAKILQQKLEAHGVTVVMTRSGDTFPSLADRVKISKDSNAEAFISIHTNAASAAAKGTETYYDTSENANGNESAKLAKEIQKQIVALADMRDRGIKDNEFYVIRNQDIPSVLVELGFITNSEDYTKLVSSKYHEIFAEAIFQGVLSYYSN